MKPRGQVAYETFHHLDTSASWEGLPAATRYVWEAIGDAIALQERKAVVEHLWRMGARMLAKDVENGEHLRPHVPVTE